MLRNVAWSGPCYKHSYIMPKSLQPLGWLFSQEASWKCAACMGPLIALISRSLNPHRFVHKLVNVSLELSKGAVCNYPWVRLGLQFIWITPSFTFFTWRFCPLPSWKEYGTSKTCRVFLTNQPRCAREQWMKHGNILGKYKLLYLFR